MSENTKEADTLTCILNGWTENAKDPNGIDPAAGIEAILATAFSHSTRSTVLIAVIEIITADIPQSSRDILANSLAKSEILCDESVSKFINTLRASILAAVNRE